MNKQVEINSYLYYIGEKAIKTLVNIPEKEIKPKKLDSFKPLNKEQVEKHLSYEQSEDILEMNMNLNQIQSQ